MKRIALVMCSILHVHKICVNLELAETRLHLTPWPKRIKLGRIAITTSSPTTKSYYRPNPGYDQYWTDGHWIFGTTTKRVSTRSTRTRPLVCGKPCPVEYRYVDDVCAHGVNFTNHTVKSKNVDRGKLIEEEESERHYTTFKTYCAFLHAQCSEDIFHSLINEREPQDEKPFIDTEIDKKYIGWVFIHFGPCKQDVHIYKPIGDDQTVLERKRIELSKFENRTQRLTAKNKTGHLIFNTRCQTTEQDFIDKTDITGSCYYISTKYEPYVYAESKCIEMGAKLIVIDNEVEDETMKQLIAQLPPRQGQNWMFFTNFRKYKTEPVFHTGPGWYQQPGSETLHEVGYMLKDNNRPEYEPDGYWQCVVLDSFGEIRYIKDCSYYNYELPPYMRFICEKMIRKRPPY